MKKLLAAFVCLTAILFFARQVALAQGTISVSTDKAQYGYGEVIEIRVSISNPTDETFQLIGSSTCQAQFRFDSFDSYENTVCTLDEVVIRFAPGSERTWLWKINPEVLGLPATIGLHTVVGYYPATELADTTTVAAPQFLGGRVGVGLKKDISPGEIASVKDSLNVEVLSSFETSNGLTETWQISGVTVDSAVARYREDKRFRYFEALRIIQYDQVVSVDEVPEAILSAELTPAYPNPCWNVCTVGLELSYPQYVRVVVYDVLGREVEILHEGMLSGGSRHLFSFETGLLANGLYLYRAEGESFSASRRVLLVR